MFTLIYIQASQIDSFQQSWQHWWRRLRRRESETFWGERCWPTFCQGNGLVHGNESCLSVLNFVRCATYVCTIDLFSINFCNLDHFSSQMNFSDSEICQYSVHTLKEIIRTTPFSFWSIVVYLLWYICDATWPKMIRYCGIILFYTTRSSTTSHVFDWS